MKAYTASISEGDTVLLDAIKVYVQEGKDRSGFEVWGGRFQLTGEAYIQPGGPYKLKLEDGRSGEIIVAQVVPSSYAPIQVAFTGTGPLA